VQESLKSYLYSLSPIEKIAMMEGQDIDPLTLKAMLENEIDIYKSHDCSFTRRQICIDVCLSILKNNGINEDVLSCAALHPNREIRRIAILHKKAGEAVMKAAMSMPSNEAFVVMSQSSPDEILFNTMAFEKCPTISGLAALNPSTTPELFARAICATNKTGRRRLIKILDQKDPIFKLAVKARAGVHSKKIRL
jgi:hypothetical protein